VRDTYFGKVIPSSPRPTHPPQGGGEGKPTIKAQGSFFALLCHHLLCHHHSSLCRMAGTCQHLSLLGRLLTPALHGRGRFAQHFLLSLLPRTGMAATTSGRFWHHSKGCSKLDSHSGASRRSENSCAALLVSRHPALAAHSPPSPFSTTTNVVGALFCTAHIHASGFNAVDQEEFSPSRLQERPFSQPSRPYSVNSSPSADIRVPARTARRRARKKESIQQDRKPDESPLVNKLTDPVEWAGLESWRAQDVDESRGLGKEGPEAGLRTPAEQQLAHTVVLPESLAECGQLVSRASPTKLFPSETLDAF
jgi:hypothetical protein